MIRAGAIINCRDNTMTMSIEGEDVVFDLVLTKSGHYILPLDSFQERMVRKAEHTYGKEKLILFENREVEEQDIEEIYETDWNHMEDETANNATVVQRIKKDGKDEMYLKVEKS